MLDDIKHKNGTDYFKLMRAMFMSYITDDETRPIISGNTHSKIKILYKIKFIHKSDVIFSSKDNLSLIVCDMTGEKIKW